MEIVKQPYELLVRWADGKLSGASMSWLLVTMDGDVAKGTVIDGPHPVTDDNANGSFLDEILSLVHQSALDAVETHKAEAVDHFQQAEAARAETEDARSQIVALTRSLEEQQATHERQTASAIRSMANEHAREVGALQARIAELEGKPSE